MRERKRWAVLSTTLIASLLFLPSASADQSPEGCLGTAPTVSFASDTTAGATSPLRQGDSIPLVARISNQAAGACDIGEVTIRARLPKPDGTPGEYRTLTSNAALAAGVAVSGFTAEPYEVNLNEGVSSARIEIDWQATVHDRQGDRRDSGVGLPAEFSVVRHEAQLTVLPSVTSGRAPLTVTTTYLLENTSPDSAAGLPGPALVPTGLGTGRRVLSDQGCEPLVYQSGDQPSLDASPVLDPGETWKFTCTRTHLLPGTYSSQPSVIGISSVDGRGWPQPTLTAGQESVRVLGSDLIVDKSHQGDLLAGRSGNYTLKVTNSGNESTSGLVTVADLLPEGLRAKKISGAGWTCDLASVSCSRSDPLASGSSYAEVTLVVSTTANPPGMVENVALVSGGGEPEGATVNNQDSDPTTIRNPAQPEPSPGRSFKVRKITTRSDGTATLKVAVPSGGKLIADDSRKPDLIQRTARKVAKAKIVALTVKANRKFRQQLRRRGKPVSVLVRVTFVSRSDPAATANLTTTRKVTFSLGG